jgi:hypothetical protein
MGESKNGNMPLDLQKGSKFAILCDSVQVKRKHAAGSPERVKVCRSHYVQVKRKHAAGSPERVKVYRSHKASIQAKHGKHAAGSPERVEVCRACEGYHLHRAVIIFFQKKALKDRPQTAGPKNSQANSQGRLNLERTSQTVGKGWRKREGESDSAFFE